MLRVRETMTQDPSCADGASAGRPSATAPSPQGRPLRLAALAAAGIALGAAGTVLTVSMVQAEDDAGIRAFHLQEAANRQAARQGASGAGRPQPQAAAYAPARSGWQVPLLQMQPDGRIAHPPVDLNPFRQGAADAARKPARRNQQARIDAVSGATDVVRTFCVRLCDGFHAPLGHLRAGSDLKAHDALCQANNPGIPVKVFRLAAGLADIGEARSADGQRYRALPMAYSHETTRDAAACRPAIVQAGERRVSLLRDFTLRPGDSVVLDGKVRTFVGGSRFPYSPRDFRDFRSAGELSKSQRREIDERVGISRLEAQARGVRRQMLLREASLRDDGLASDADRFVLRGSLDPLRRGPVRMISLVVQD
ncbi:MAG: DUF2865 domain-containing protein [Bosea sp. (in: a-proteobacteria)]|uniref:DUF2865 domain-containing protein n=1 Tax=Bosea sp. (in: a-proteobacteria) TaxID=1871050 RepID=UPI0027344A9A|nr:DUF2865 domain-containing protein [Bosea sp. (in: a-proteobacteria)]MDP3256852.1 DUF2865 domain-containing protein [Bosea sp. (in: a-proteobacteria)]MDP3321806.1 DUF2865 domain-containing protein [Bosea sp. (in: a-proteobacteria)]